MDIKALESIGGKRWQSGSMDRVYFNDLHVWYGLRVVRDDKGRVAAAWLDGQETSKTNAHKIMESFAFSKLYYDFEKGGWWSKSLTATDHRIMVEAIEAAYTEAVKAMAEAEAAA